MKASALDVRRQVATKPIEAAARSGVARPTVRDVALPLAVALTALAALALTPPVIGFTAAVGAACVWTWWLESHSDTEHLAPPPPVSFMTADTPANRAANAVERHRSRPSLSAARVLVCMPPDRLANLEIQSAAVLADRIGGVLLAAYVVAGRGSMAPDGVRSDVPLASNISLAETLGATVIKVDADEVVDGLLALADREGVTHAVLGYSGAPSDLFSATSVAGRFAIRARGIEIAIVARKPTDAPAWGRDPAATQSNTPDSAA